jgi:hypothetical protein
MEFSFSNVAIHKKSLEISVEETGAIYGLSAVVGVLTPLGLGLIAELGVKLGNFKVCSRLKIFRSDIYFIILIIRCF